MPIIHTMSGSISMKNSDQQSKTIELDSPPNIKYDINDFYFDIDALTSGKGPQVGSSSILRAILYLKSMFFT